MAHACFCCTFNERRTKIENHFKTEKIYLAFFMIFHDLDRDVVGKGFLHSTYVRWLLKKKFARWDEISVILSLKGI